MIVLVLLIYFNLFLLEKINGILINFFIIIFFFLQIVFFTTCERKIMALTQRRVGPNILGDRGRLQYIADALKLFLKSNLTHKKINNIAFQSSAVLVFYMSWFNFLNINFNYGEDINEIEYNIFFTTICSLGFSLGWLVSGWASSSKYALLGCIRSFIQIISYEILTSLVFLIIFLIVNTTNFEIIVNKQEDFSLFFTLPSLCIYFFLFTLMETNRPPFDLSEAESDLVAGYIVEYSSIIFGLFYLGEYINIFCNSLFIMIIFSNYIFDIFILFKNLINFIIIIM